MLIRYRDKEKWYVATDQTYNHKEIMSLAYLDVTETLTVF